MNLTNPALADCEKKRQTITCHVYGSVNLNSVQVKLWLLVGETLLSMIRFRTKELTQNFTDTYMFTHSVEVSEK